MATDKFSAHYQEATKGVRRDKTIHGTCPHEASRGGP